MGWNTLPRGVNEGLTTEVWDDMNTAVLVAPWLSVWLSVVSHQEWTALNFPTIVRDVEARLL